MSDGNQQTPINTQMRKTTQYLMPKTQPDAKDGEVYNIYPVTKLAPGKIFNGYGSFAKWIIEQKTVVIDCFSGVIWDTTKNALQAEIEQAGLKVNFIATADYFKSSEEIEKLVQPF